ncbi:MAG: hypothetical protein V8T47_06695 [Oscillospiraceae bacterium]
MEKNILNKLIRNRSAMIGLTVIVVLLFAGIFADKLTTHNPELTDITNKFRPRPGNTHSVQTRWADVCFADLFFGIQSVCCPQSRLLLSLC